MKGKMKLIFLAILATVSAFAQAGAQHSCTLNWTQSTTPGITSNNLYRGSVSGGPYMLVNSSSSPSTSYVDTSVTASTTYYYVVTALVGTEESLYSMQATCAVPATTTAPTNLTVTAK
jgi:fibronectin type 3 domain-containing protein